MQRLQNTTFKIYLMVLLNFLPANLLAEYDYGLGRSLSSVEKVEIKKADPKLEKVSITREFSIILSKEGYYPRSIAIYKGEKVRFYLTSTADTPGCFTIPSKNFFLGARRGAMTEGDVVFEEPGSYPFYCPGTEGRGEVVVLEKFKTKRTLKESSAENPSTNWVPK